MSDRSDLIDFSAHTDASSELNLVDISQSSLKLSPERRAQMEREFQVRRGDSDQILDRESKKSLATWLKQHQAELEGALPKDILRKFYQEVENASEEERSQSDAQQQEAMLKGNVDGAKGLIHMFDLAHVYAQRQWPDGRPLSKDDERMFLLAGKYLNKRDGQRAGGITPFDLEALAGGARQWTEHGSGSDREVCVFPNGTKVVHKDGSVLTEKPDGTLILEQASYGDLGRSVLTLKANGTGEMSMHDGLIRQKIRRGADGLWLSKDADGNEVKFDFNAAVVQITSPQLEVRIEKRGGMMSDKLGNATVEVRSGRFQLSGGDEELLTGKDGTMLYASGKQETVVFPNGFSVVKDDSGQLEISSAVHANLPLVIVAADGSISARLDDVSFVASKASDGSQEIAVSDKMKICRNDRGDVEINLTLPAGNRETFTVHADRSATDTVSIGKKVTTTRYRLPQ